MATKSKNKSPWRYEAALMIAAVGGLSLLGLYVNNSKSTEDFIPVTVQETENEKEKLHIQEAEQEVEVVHKEEAEHDEAVHKEAEVVEETEVVEEAVHIQETEHEEEAVHKQEIEHGEEIPLSVEEGDGNEVVSVVEESSPSQIEFVGDNDINVIAKEEAQVESEDEVITIDQEDLAKAEAESKIKEDMEREIQQAQLLTTAYENLRIILDDTITTKTSAINMFNGYISQLSQALLVASDDPAYESIWENISAVDRNIKESIDLVRVKETELNSQIEDINGLIYYNWKYEVSELTGKAEELILGSKKRLLVSQSEIEILTSKRNLLLQVRKRLDGSPATLQKYLRIFIPDLMNLINSKNIDVENLSEEDTLLMLSLRRPELIYAEAEEKEKDLQLQFEETLQQHKENVSKEVYGHVNNMIEKIEADKNNEMNQKVEDLKHLHENHLQEELTKQHVENQQELRDAMTKQEAELAAQHKTESESMLSELEDRHHQEIKNNWYHISGIESKITEVLDIDEESQKRLNLWGAVHALNTALSDVLDNGRTKQLTPEISNILHFNPDDGTLATIISTVPESAISLGVIPEYNLKQNFSDIKRVCKKVAMVKSERGSFLSYTFSYIKSLFVITRFYQRHTADEIDLETLGPYEILEKADYCIQKGDLEQAAKFMNQLKGVPRKLSTNWVKEVRLLLETKQSVNLLMAYVGSLNAGFE